MILSRTEIEKRIQEIESIPSHLREFEEKAYLRNLKRQLYYLNGGK